MRRVSLIIKILPALSIRRVIAPVTNGYQSLRGCATDGVESQEEAWPELTK
jgi:hypothetical protein